MATSIPIFRRCARNFGNTSSNAPGRGRPRGLSTLSNNSQYFNDARRYSNNYRPSPPREVPYDHANAGASPIFVHNSQRFSSPRENNAVPSSTKMGNADVESTSKGQHKYRSVRATLPNDARLHDQFKNRAAPQPYEEPFGAAQKPARQARAISLDEPAYQQYIPNVATEIDCALFAHSVDRKAVHTHFLKNLLSKYGEVVAIKLLNPEYETCSAFI